MLNGADAFIGGTGDDIVTYRNRLLPVHVSADGFADDGSAGEGDNVEPDIEQIFGGAVGTLSERPRRARSCSAISATTCSQADPVRTGSEVPTKAPT